MQSRFRFRAWDKSVKYMLQFDGFEELAEVLSNYRHDPDDLIWMQSNGKQDKNDKFLFDGDRVDKTYPGGSCQRGEIKFVDGGMFFQVKGKNFSSSEFVSHITDCMYEIIGNIYE